MSTPTGQRLGRYELLARLATGGMGEIFLARLEGAAGFEKLYVIKRILPHLADDARFRTMLVEEARVTSKMAHANICQVYELGETAGQLYIVMEYLEGVTILPLLRKASKDGKPLDFGFIGAVISQVCDGLHYAHELRERGGSHSSLGVVHRDVTPSNVFLTESGVAKVLDFGIAKVKDAAVNTQTGTVKGKYAYMAPEQLRGVAIDRRVDIFALGIVLYEMTALRRLFQRKTDYLTFRAVMEQPLPDVRRYRPDIPTALADVISRALDRDPDARFATARAFREAVLDALGSRRPWGQSDCGDFLRANFTDELGRRHEQVSEAVHRGTDPGLLLGGGPDGPMGSRSGMPTVVGGGEADDLSIEEDDEFPSVEETMDEMPAAIRIEHRRAETAPAAFVENTPPPFALETSTSGASLQPLTPPAIAPAPRRSLVWPLVALAMVGVAGAALFLVWRQTQNQQAPQPPIVITTTTTTVPPPPPPEAPPAPATPGSGSAPHVVPPQHQQQPPQPPPPHVDYQGAINGAFAKLQGKLVDCVARYGLPPVGTIVAVSIGLDGRARAVVFKPTDPDKQFAACVSAVITATAFPKPAVEWVQEVLLRKK